jgi:hypothetical protein
METLVEQYGYATIQRAMAHHARHEYGTIPSVARKDADPLSYDGKATASDELMRIIEAIHRREGGTVA